MLQHDAHVFDWALEQVSFEREIELLSEENFKRLGLDLEYTAKFSLDVPYDLQECGPKPMPGGTERYDMVGMWDE